MASPRHECRLKVLGVEHRSLQTQADVAGARRDDAAEARSKSTGHPRLHGQLGRYRLTGTLPPDRLEHPRRPAGVDLAVLTGARQFLGQELGHGSVMAGRAVIGGHPGAGQQCGPLGAALVPEAQHHRDVGAELILPDGQRGDAHSSSHQNRSAVLPREPEAPAEWPHEPQPGPRLKLAQPPRPGTDVLNQELELGSSRVAGGPQDAEGAGQKRPLALSPAPPLGRGQHVELARLRGRAGRIQAAQDDIRTVGFASDDFGQPTAEGSQRSGLRDGRRRASARAHPATELEAWGAPAPWIS